MHCARMRNVVSYRSLYFSQDLAALLPKTMCIVEVNALLQALIERMAFWNWDKPEHEQTHTLAFFCEELALALLQQLHLSLPQDLRLQKWLTTLTTGHLPPLIN